MIRSIVKSVTRTEAATRALDQRSAALGVRGSATDGRSIDSSPRTGTPGAIVAELIALLLRFGAIDCRMESPETSASRWMKRIRCFLREILPRGSDRGPADRPRRERENRGPGEEPEPR